MANWSRQKLNNLLKATEDVCGRAGIWIAIEWQLLSVNVSVVGIKNMAILLFSAFGELRPVPSAWQEYVPMACFSVVLLPNGWDFQAEGLTEVALSVAVLLSVEWPDSCWYYHINCFNFIFSDTFRVKKSPKRSPLSDPPSQVKYCLILMHVICVLVGAKKGNLIHLIVELYI